MTPQISDELLGRLSAFVTEAFGLRFPPDRWNELARGIASAALELGIPDLCGWAEALVGGARPPEQLAAVANHLTISETYFFRQIDTFNVLEETVLPVRLAERRQQRRGLRIWSAGCASGEEPYSVAILLRRRFPDVTPEAVTILATDINAHVLKRAATGVYTEWSFRDTPPWLREDYFVHLPNRRYEISPEIRRMVRFVALNLAAPYYPVEFGDHADLDVILCRNVLMYFSAEWQDRIVRRFASALAPGGWLFVGPCDVTAEESVELHLIGSRPGVFQKQTKPETASPSHRPELKAPAARPATPVVIAPAVAQPEAKVAAPENVAAPSAADRARLHADRGELEQALTACDEALAENNMQADVQHLRACVLMELDRLEEAEGGFRRVLYLEPESVMAHFALGSLAQRAGRTREARHHFNLVLRALASRNHGEPVPRGDGMTVGRLRDVVEHSLGSPVS